MDFEERIKQMRTQKKQERQQKILVAKQHDRLEQQLQSEREYLAAQRLAACLQSPEFSLALHQAKEELRRAFYACHLVMADEYSHNTVTSTTFFDVELSPVTNLRQAYIKNRVRRQFDYRVSVTDNTDEIVIHPGSYERYCSHYTSFDKKAGASSLIFLPYHRMRYHYTDRIFYSIRNIRSGSDGKLWDGEVYAPRLWEVRTMRSKLEFCRIEDLLEWFVPIIERFYNLKW